MSTVAVNCEAARVGGTRSHLRGLLAGAQAGGTPLVPLARDPLGDGRERDTALSLRDRLIWDRRGLPAALAAVDADVLLQPSNIGLLGRSPLPTVQVLHNLAPLVDHAALTRGRLKRRLRLLRHLTRRALRLADGVVFLSQAALDEVRRQGWEGSATLIRPGIPTVPPALTPSGAPRRPVVVVVAHLFRYKRVEDAIGGFLRSGLAREGLRLEVLGAPYDRPYANALGRLVAGLGPGAPVALVGDRTPREAVAAVAGAAAVVQPSSCENAPQVVYEALACGTPLVASDIPAHAELLDGGLYAVGDVEALGQLLCAAVHGRLANGVRVELPTWPEVARETAAFCSACVASSPRVVPA